jgi:hypothetical protein
MITTVTSPFVSTSAPTAPSASAATTTSAPAEPHDVLVASAGSAAAELTSHGLSTMGKAAVGLMMGATVLGAGVLAPARAEAHEMRTEVSIARPVRYEGFRGGYHGGYRGGDAGAVIGGAILGGILGGVIGSTLPPPVVIPVPGPVYPGPVVVSPGYNAVGCDGVMHHFDGYGNVSDATGTYRLQQNQYGQCYRTAPVYAPYATY